MIPKTNAWDKDVVMDKWGVLAVMANLVDTYPSSMNYHVSTRGTMVCVQVEKGPVSKQAEFEL